MWNPIWEWFFRADGPWLQEMRRYAFYLDHNLPYPNSRTRGDWSTAMPSESNISDDHHPNSTRHTFDRAPGRPLRQTARRAATNQPVGAGRDFTTTRQDSRPNQLFNEPNTSSYNAYTIQENPDLTGGSTELDLNTIWEQRLPQAKSSEDFIRQVNERARQPNPDVQTAPAAHRGFDRASGITASRMAENQPEPSLMSGHEGMAFSTTGTFQPFRKSNTSRDYAYIPQQNSPGWYLLDEEFQSYLNAILQQRLKTPKKAVKDPNRQSIARQRQATPLIKTELPPHILSTTGTFFQVLPNYVALLSTHDMRDDGSVQLYENNGEPMDEKRARSAVKPLKFDSVCVGQIVSIRGGRGVVACVVARLLDTDHNRHQDLYVVNALVRDSNGNIARGLQMKRRQVYAYPGVVAVRPRAYLRYGETGNPGDSFRFYPTP